MVPSNVRSASASRILGLFTAQFNMTGQPAVSLPIGMSSDGLPIGIQLAARYGDEATLIRVSSQLERAMSWHERKPAIWVGS